MKNKINLNRQRGQGMSEYIIITALIAVAGIGIFAKFGDVIGDQTAAMTREMAGQDGSAAVTSAKTDSANAVTKAGQKDTLSTFHSQN